MVDGDLTTDSLDRVSGGASRDIVGIEKNPAMNPPREANPM
jgi:hypothetical protein